MFGSDIVRVFPATYCFMSLVNKDMQKASLLCSSSVNEFLSYQLLMGGTHMCSSKGTDKQISSSVLLGTLSCELRIQVGLIRLGAALGMLTILCSFQIN